MKNFQLPLFFSLLAFFLPSGLNANGENDQIDTTLKNKSISSRNHDQSKVPTDLAVDTTVKPVVSKTEQPKICPPTPTSPSNPYYKPVLCCAAHRAVRTSYL